MKVTNHHLLIIAVCAAISSIFKVNIFPIITHCAPPQLPRQMPSIMFIFINFFAEKYSALAERAKIKENKRNKTKKTLRFSRAELGEPKSFAFRFMRSYAFPIILKTLVPQNGHSPFAAFILFFIITSFGFFISTSFLHFMHLPLTIVNHPVL